MVNLLLSVYFLGLAITLFLGAGLVLAPGVALRFMHNADRALVRISNRSWRVERFFYRHHRSMGALLVVASGYTLFELARASGHTVVWIPSAFGGASDKLLNDALRSFLYLAHTGTLVLGGIVLLRPSLLKSFEAWCNRWVSQPTATISGVADSFASRFPRFTGLIILVAVVQLALTLRAYMLHVL